MHIPDVGPLPVLIIVLLSAIAKFYWFVKNRSWLTFSDGMARIGLALFYFLAYISTSQGTFAAEQDNWRALARLGVAALFSIEALPWVISLFQKGHKP